MAKNAYQKRKAQLKHRILRTKAAIKKSEAILAMPEEERPRNQIIIDPDKPVMKGKEVIQPSANDRLTRDKDLLWELTCNNASAHKLAQVARKAGMQS